MKRFSEQLHKKSQTVKLKASERSDLRERLVSYMEYHPLSAEMKEKKLTKVPNEIYAESFKAISIPFKSIFKYGSAFAALLIVAVPFIAEKSVPGDSLYAIKVQFNEEVRGTLTFDSYQKVEWETERVNRRIAEAKLLASEGKLTEEVEAEVAQAVREHTANAQREIEALRVEDEDAAKIASIALDTTLEVQSSSLKETEAKNEIAMVRSLDNSTSPTNLIADAIDQSRIPTDNNQATSTLPAYDKMMARVEFNTTRIYELLEALKQNVTEEELSEVTRRVDDINRAIAEAIDLREVDESEAKKKLVSVLQSSQKLIVLMTDLHVVKDGDLDTLMPVVLTPEEKESNKLNLAGLIEEKNNELGNQLEKVENQGLLDKLLVTTGEINSLLEEIAPTTTEYEVYVKKSEEVIILLDDALSAVGQSLNPELPEEDVNVNRGTSTDDEIDLATTTSTTSDELIVETEVSSGTEDSIEI